MNRNISTRWLVLFSVIYLVFVLIFGPFGSSSDMAGLALAAGIPISAVITTIIAVLYHSIRFYIRRRNSN